MVSLVVFCPIPGVETTALDHKAIDTRVENRVAKNLLHIFQKLATREWCFIGKKRKR